MEFVEGILMAGEKGLMGAEKQVAHKEWTKDPLPDDFNDTDLN